MMSAIIALLIAKLIVDHRQSIEKRINDLTQEQKEQKVHYEEIETYITQRADLKISQIVSKADAVNANLISISERYPWLEYITERDIIVETESVRGILETSYHLLRDEKYLHLYEYLEYCSRKKTPFDGRLKKNHNQQDVDPKKLPPLQGTVDDFLKIASFCEVWLEDYALGIEFLDRYIDKVGNSQYLMYPDYIHRLLRMGELPEAQKKAISLNRILKKHDLYNLLSFFPVTIKSHPISEYYYWYAKNILSLTNAIISNKRRAIKDAEIAKASPFASIFQTQQKLFNAELSIYLMEFAVASETLATIEKHVATFPDLHYLALLWKSIGEDEKAATIRKRIIDMRYYASNDTLQTIDSYKY